MKQTRFYLARSSTPVEGAIPEKEQKLKYGFYNLGFTVASYDEAPTYFDKETEANTMATALNTMYRLTKTGSYVDVFREEVTITKMTDNNPDKDVKNSESNSTVTTASQSTQNQSTQEGQAER